MLHSFENAVLANILRGEHKAVGFSCSERHSVMHVINILHLPLVEVFHKAVHVMTLRAIQGRVLVIFLNFLHHHESQLLIINRENEVGTRLVNSLNNI